MGLGTRLHHTVHCGEKIVSAHLHVGSASAERVGQGEMGGVTHRVTCTWWLGLALKGPWLVPGGPPPTLTAWTGFENTSHLVEGLFLAVFSLRCCVLLPIVLTYLLKLRVSSQKK